MMILAPLAASLVQMAISRSREYEADRMGAEISGQPLWLASALAKLHAGTQQIPNQVAEANPATAHLYIANPLSAGGLAACSRPIRRWRSASRALRRWRARCRLRAGRSRRCRRTVRGRSRATGAAPRPLGLIPTAASSRLMIMRPAGSRRRGLSVQAFSTIFQNESFFMTLSPRKV